MNLDAKDFLNDLAVESSPEEPNLEEKPSQPSEELYDPWDGEEDPPERRHDPLRQY